MAIYKYTKSIVDIDVLTIEITQASLPGFNFIRFKEPDDLDILFSNPLDTADESTLNDIITNHTGVTLYEAAGTLVVANGQGGFDFASNVSPITESLAVAQVRRTTDLSLTDSWQDVTFDTVDIETYTDVVERDDVNTDRILIKENGTYEIFYSFPARSLGATRNVYSRIRKNDTTELVGSYNYQNLYKDETHDQTRKFNAVLTSGDYITLQVQAASTPISTIGNYILSVVKLDGIKGEDGTDGVDGVDGAQGPPGSGSTILVQDEGTTVSGSPHSIVNFTGAGVEVTSTTSGTVTVDIQAGGSSGLTIEDEGTPLSGGPHSTLNFTGQMVTATDAGGGEATIDIPYQTFGTWYAWGGDDSATSSNSTSPVQKATLGVTGIPLGYYRLSWYYEWRRNNVRTDFSARIQIDNSTTVMEHSQEPKDTSSWYTEAGFVIVQLTAGDHDFDLDYWGENSSYTNYMRRARFEIWRVA